MSSTTPSISFNGTLENVYTKTECDEKFGGGGGTIPADLSVNTLTLNNTTGLTLRGVKFSSTNEWAVIASCVLDDSPRELFSIHQDGRIRMDRFWSLSMGRFSYDIIDDNPIMHIMSFGGDYSGGIPSKLLIQAGTIEFDGTLANVYTKAEVDEKIPVKERGANTWYGYELTRSKENSKFCFYIGTSGENCATLIFDPTDKHFGIGLLNGGDNEMLKFYANNTAEFTCKVSAPNISSSQTITHEAPYVGEPDEYTVGDPVFASGRVCRYDMTTNEWTTETGPTDCICEVKPEGTVGEYMGICVGFNENTKSLIFATHGDYYFNVADSSKYKIGDIILLDGSVLKDDMALTGKVMKMVVGKITGKINKTTVAVLKD